MLKLEGNSAGKRIKPKSLKSILAETVKYKPENNRDKTEDFIVTFDQVMPDDTYEKHDQTNAPLELPPSQVVAGDPVSFVSDKMF